MSHIKSNILQVGIYCLGAICLVVFMLCHFTKLPDFIIHNEIKKSSQLTTIKSHIVPLPTKQRSYQKSTKNPPLNDADILTIGDSFFDFSTQKTIPERLSDSLKLKVHYSRGRLPLNILYNKKLEKSQKERLLIFGLVERNIPGLIYNDLNKSRPTRNTNIDRAKRILYASIGTDKERNYNYLLRSSKLTYDIYSEYSTLRYTTLGYTENNAPHFKVGNEPWLFYFKTTNQEPTSFFYQHSQHEMEKYAEYLYELKKELKEQYNLRLIFMPIPNKVSIYHNYAFQQPYSQFLPTLYKELEDRSIEYIELFEQFKKSKKTLYFPTDTHWNKEGVDIAMTVLLEYLEENQLIEIKGSFTHE